MVKKFKITYTSGKGEHQEEITASSKYDAKSKFYKKYPKAEIVKVEEISNDNQQKEVK
jgi:hypothetical protein